MTSNSNIRAIMLMIAAMGVFSLTDSLVKISTVTMSPAQVMFYLISGGSISFIILALYRGDQLVDQRAFSSILILRYIAEIIGMIGMLTALAKVPISTVGAITQATPFLAAVGAVIFLKEKVGWRRWLSILIGFVGVLFIVQPGGIEFDLSILWAILALAGLSARDLITRLVPHDMPSASLATFTMIAALPFTITWVLLSGESLVPENINWFVLIPMMLFGAFGYMLLIASIRMAEVSIVMPYRYSRVLFLFVIGVVVFGEKPNLLMFIGAALIIISGIYMMWREQKVK